MQHNGRMESPYEPANAPQNCLNREPSRMYVLQQERNYPIEQQHHHQNQNQPITQQVQSQEKQLASMPFNSPDYRQQHQQNAVSHANGFVNGRHESSNRYSSTNTVARAQMMHQTSNHQQQPRHHTNCQSLATLPQPLHYLQHQQEQHQEPQHINYPLIYDQVVDTGEPEQISYLPTNYALNHFNLEPDLANSHASQNFARQFMLMDEQQQYTNQMTHHDYGQDESYSSYYCPIQLDQQQQQAATYQSMSSSCGLSNEPTSSASVKLGRIVDGYRPDEEDDGGVQDSNPATAAGRSLEAPPIDDMARAMQDSVGVARATSGAAPAGCAFSADWLDSICRQVIEHMNRYGICVIDNFFGNERGNAIFEEVRELYETGRHISGRLVNDRFANGNSGSSVGAIRNDRVIWISGAENGCSKINGLIQTLCSVVTNSIRLSLYSNNALDNIVINRRTKAHVACYPGNGTRYVKHVDNPNGDGRLITAIYYVNKNWSVKHEGGLLRMYPTGMNEVANIEPLFDRVLFFWSDRRNPHEVLPAYRDRFAITVWFMGETRSRD